MTFTPSCVLVTGGAGFIGSNFIRWLLTHTSQLHVVNLDALTYAGNIENLQDISAAHGSNGDGRYHFIHGDVRDRQVLSSLLNGTVAEDAAGLPQSRPIPLPDCVVHFAAESHVDRSILDPSIFVATNVGGTLALLESCRVELHARARPFRFVQVSTDEVYGTLGPHDAPFSETTPLAPNSPYSASKAGADLLVRSYVETFGLPAIVTRCSNNFGPYQFPEKLIPLMITRALADRSLPVYGDGLQVRDWLYVDDHAAALWAVITRGHLGGIYNIGSGVEQTNIAVVRALLKIMQKPESLIEHVRDRAGHDRRYAMNADKICRELGWFPAHTFDAGLDNTVRWYLNHRKWWDRVLSEAYRATNTLYLNRH